MVFKSHRNTKPRVRNLTFETPSPSPSAFNQIIGTTAAPTNLQDAASSLFSLLNFEGKTWELLHASSLLNCRANQRLLLQALEAVCTTGIAGIGTVMTGRGCGP